MEKRPINLPYMNRDKFLLTMKFTLLLFFIGVMKVSAGAYSQNLKLNLDLRQVAVEQVFEEVKKQSDINFLYRSDLLDNIPKVDISLKNASLEKVLSQVLLPFQLTYEIEGKTVIIHAKKGKKSTVIIVPRIEYETINGTVKDEFGFPVPGATILIKGTTRGTVTDPDGNYTIVAEPGEVLIFSFIGYLKQEVIIGNITEIDIVLEEDQKALEEVVVVGYTAKKQSELSSAVAVVDEKQLKEGVVSQDLGNMLQGKVSGLTISNSGGRPGDKTNIVIRGVGSIGAGYEPLYVVDGVIGGSANPMDIETITVLKDAAATGLYGSRAANGVIVITTKKGKSGETKVRYSSSFGATQQRNGNLDMMNSSQLYDRQSEGYLNFYNSKVEAGDPNFTNKTFDEYLESVLPSSLLDKDTDWQSLLSRTGFINQQQITVSGGTDKTTFYVSGNYYDEKGSLLNTYYKNYDFRINLSHQLSKRITFNTRIFTGTDKRPNEPLGGQEGTLAQYYNNMPWDPAFESDGVTPYNPSGLGNTWIGNARSNHFYNVEHQSDITRNNRFGGDLQLDVKLTDWMKFSTSNRVTYHGSKWNQVLDKDHQLANFENGRVSTTIGEDFNFITSNLLNMGYSFGNHNLGGVLGQEFNYITNSYTTAVGIGLPGDLSSLNAAGSPKTVGGNTTETGFLSYFGQVDYDYNGKYFLVASLRGDASSRFGKDNKWATFYSIGGSWVVSNENFLKNVEWIDLLKIRGSHGTTGNANIAPYLSLGTYSFSNETTYNGLSGSRPSRIENPALTWEIAHNSDMGIEFSILNRFGFEIDFYNRVNKSLLQNVPISAASGFTNQQRNVGSVRNRGIDLSLNANVIEGDFDWDLGFNINFNRNKVLELNGHEDIANGIMRIRENLPLRYFYMKEWAGVDPETGSPLWVRWEDSEGNLIHGANKVDPANITTTSVYNEASNLFIKSAYPDYTGGIRNDFFYKNFSLSILFNFAVGQSIYFSARERIDSDNNSTNQNQMNLYKDWSRWREPGDIATHPRLLTGGSATNGTSSRYLEEGSYLRLQNIRLGYTFPNEIKKVSNLRLFVSGDYLAVFTKFSGADPDVNMENSVINQNANGARFSPTRKFMFGLSFDL